MMKKHVPLRQMTVDALLIALALVLSLAERWIPLELVIPIPGIKLGLANVVTLFALLRLSVTDAFVIVLLRSVILGLITGPTTLLFSLSGGLLAWVVMAGLIRWHDIAFSVVGISLAGASAHNIGQVAMASLLLNESLMWVTYLPPLLLTGLVTGTLTGVAAYPLIRRFPGHVIPLSIRTKQASLKPDRQSSQGKNPGDDS
jgi:heptaprenyl diphosphate synthase